MNSHLKYTLKAILSIAAVLVALFVIICAVYIFKATRSNRIASDPVKLVKSAGFKLPNWNLVDYNLLSYDDNLDRSSSAWSSVEWEIELKEPLSESDLENLSNLCKKDYKWIAVPGINVYMYQDIPVDDDSDPELHIKIDVKTGRISISYSWWDFLS